MKPFPFLLINIATLDFLRSLVGQRFREGIRQHRSYCFPEITKDTLSFENPHGDLKLAVSPWKSLHLEGTSTSSSWDLGWQDTRIHKQGVVRVGCASSVSGCSGTWKLPAGFSCGIRTFPFEGQCAERETASSIFPALQLSSSGWQP